MAEGAGQGVDPLAGAEDVDVLCPDREVSIAGEVVTVREYSFAQGLRLARYLAPLVEALALVVTDSEGDDDALLESAFSDESEAVMALMAASCGKDVAWVEGLSDDDGRALMFAWWAANKDFFVRRLLLRQALIALPTAAEAQTSGPSLPH